MSSWKVRLSNTNGHSAFIELMDTLGPLNQWKSTDPNAFIPNRGDFTNQTKNVVPTVQPTWKLEQLDIDDVRINDTGPGEVLDNDGTFPVGPVTWTVINSI